MEIPPFLVYQDHYITIAEKKTPVTVGIYI